MNTLIEPPKQLKSYKPSVLIFEDEEIIRGELSNYLEENGVAVHAFAEADAALNAISETEFDVAIVDITGSSGSPEGLEIRKRLRDVQPSAEVFVISGFPKYKRDVGDQEFHPKPITREKRNLILERIFTRYSIKTGIQLMREVESSGIVEDAQVGKWTISFHDQKLGWGMFEAQPPGQLERVVPVGTEVQLRILYQQDKIKGFRVINVVNSQNPELSECEKLLPTQPNDFNNQIEFAKYQASLRVCLGE